MYSRLVLGGNCHPRSIAFSWINRLLLLQKKRCLKECEARSFVRAGKTNYRVSGFGVSHSLAERIPYVLKAEGAGLGQGRPGILSVVDQNRTRLG